jgi:hypothetical protein
MKKHDMEVMLLCYGYISSNDLVVSGELQMDSSRYYHSAAIWFVLIQ